MYKGGLGLLSMCKDKNPFYPAIAILYCDPKTVLVGNIEIVQGAANIYALGLAIAIYGQSITDAITDDFIMVLMEMGQAQQIIWQYKYYHSNYCKYCCNCGCDLGINS